MPCKFVGVTRSLTDDQPHQHAAIAVAALAALAVGVAGLPAVP